MKKRYNEETLQRRRSHQGINQHEAGAKIDDLCGELASRTASSQTGIATTRNWE